MNFIVNISAFFSTALAIYYIIPYISAVIKGKTKPHQLTWIVYTIMHFITFFSQFLSGGRLSVLISLVFFIGSFITFLLSLKYGIRNSSKWDKTLFIFAICAIILWYITKSNSLAIWLTLIIDLAAGLMMALKIKAHPYSEDPIPWIVITIAYMFSILTLVGQPLSILYVRPTYGFLIDFVFVLFIYIQRSKAKRTDNESIAR